MGTIIFLLIAVVAGLFLIILARLHMIKRTLKQMTEQLKEYNLRKTDKKLDIRLTNQHMEALAVEINRLIDLRVQENIDKRRTALELKQAIANISHDLRTPLTSIIGYIQLIESEDSSAEDKKTYYAVSKRRTKQLQDLLNEFFELSLIESSDYELKFAQVRLDLLVSEHLMTYYDAFEENKIQPDIDFLDKKTIIWADESAVKRVLDNLLVNALKHAKTHVSIQFQVTSDHAVFSISNDAKQLTDKDIPFLFDRFYTGNKSRQDSGTGLGLTIAKNLMHKMNGRLSAELKDNQLHISCTWPLLRD